MSAYCRICGEVGHEGCVSDAYLDGYNAALGDIAEVIEEYGKIADPSVIAAAVRKAAMTR